MFSPLFFGSLWPALLFLRESAGTRRAYSHCNTPGRGTWLRRDSRNSSLRPVSENQRNNLISWQQQQRLVFPVDYLLGIKEQDVFGKRTCSQCSNMSRLHSPSFHYWLQVSFLFFSHIHLQVLGRVWRKPNAVVTSVTFPVSQGWAVAAISSLMFSRHLCCRSASDIIRGLLPTSPDSSQPHSSQRACALLPPLSRAGSCSALFNCLCKWQIVWYRWELWTKNLPTDALVGKHSSVSPFMVVWRCSHLSSSHLHLALTTGLCPFGWIGTTQAANLTFGTGEVMRGFFRGAGACSGAQWLTGNLPEQFHSPGPFQLLLILSVDTYHSRVYYSRDWKTSEGVGTTSEGTGMVTGVFFSQNQFWESNGNYGYKVKWTHLIWNVHLRSSHTMLWGKGLCLKALISVKS